jgi:tetratricopeptide (TPR) repeat protein
MSNEENLPSGNVTIGNNAQNSAIVSTVHRKFIYQTAQLRHAEHYLQVLLETRRLYEQGGEAIKLGLALFDLEWSNVQVGWEWAKHHVSTIPRALELCCEYPNAFALVDELRQHPRERIAWREVALSAAQKLGRKDLQSIHVGSLGISFWYLGEHGRAIELYEQVLAICHESGDKNGEGKTLGNLGNAYRSLGESQQAIECFERALSIFREISNRRGEVLTLNNLGIVYLDEGEYRRAIAFYEQALPICLEIGDHRIKSAALGNLGIAHKNLGETQRAIELNEQQLVIAREIGDRSTEGAALWNRALAMEILGDYAKAVASAEAALVISEQIESSMASRIRKKLETWQNEGRVKSE